MVDIHFRVAQPHSMATHHTRQVSARTLELGPHGRLNVVDIVGTANKKGLARLSDRKMWGARPSNADTMFTRF